MSSAVYTRGKVGWVRSFAYTRPDSFFRRISRSSCVSEYPVIVRMYPFTNPRFFFDSLKYRNLPSVRPIQSYASPVSFLLNRALIETLKNSLACAILTMLSSFMLMVIQPAWYGGSAWGSPLGSLYAGISFHFSTVLHWNRLRLYRS